MKTFRPTLRSYFWALLLAAPLLARPVFADGEAGAKPAKVDPDAAAKAKLELVGAGELRLDGTLSAMLGAGTWEMSATSWTSPRGVTTDFDELKKKGVQISDTTYIHPRGELEKVPLQEVKLGSHIAVIGKNGEDGVNAREIVLLEGYGSRKEVGVLSTNRVTSALVDQSRAARDAGEFPKAMTLIERAISAAQGVNDVSGEGLATQDKALLYDDMGQPQQALASFKRVTELGQRLGNALLQTLGMRGQAGIMMQTGRLTDAVAVLTEAEPISSTTEKEIHYEVESSLAIAYLLSGQREQGVATLGKVSALERVQGKDADEGETLLTIAALEADDKPEQSRQALTEGKVRLDRAQDDKSKGKLLGAMGLLQWRLGDKDEARQSFTQAAQLFKGTGDEAMSKRWEGMAANLEGSGASWQEFFAAAMGVKSAADKPDDGNTAPPADGAAG